MGSAYGVGEALFTTLAEELSYDIVNDLHHSLRPRSLDAPLCGNLRVCMKSGFGVRKFLCCRRKQRN